MVNYIIEGTISELSKNEGKYTFKISGTEGYSIKQKSGKESIKSNVLCLNDTSVIDNKKPRNAVVIPTDNVFQAEADDVLLLSVALVNGKRCKLALSEKRTKSKKGDCIDYEVSSITLLAD